VAPFHIMATERTVHSDKDHVWHMAEIAAVVGNASELLLATPYQVVDPRTVNDCSHARDAPQRAEDRATELRGDRGAAQCR
jgi:hypothetical protein